MALPRQVEKQLKDLENLEKQMQAPAEPDGQTAEVTDSEPLNPPKAEAAPTEPVAPAIPEETWEHKYHRLQGKYDNEVPRLHQQNRDLQTQFTELQRQMAELKTVPPKDAPKPDHKLVTDQDEATYGADLIDLQRRVAQEVAAEFTALIESQRAKIAELETLVTKTGNAVGEMTFAQKLASRVPDFEAVNADPRWISWLDEVDPILRAPRRMVAQDAFDKGDADAVADYVALWKKLTVPTKADARRTELERQVTPSRAGSASSPAPAAKIYSASEADAVFTKVRSLNVAGKYDEANKLEAEISAAYLEGRVR